MLTGDQEARTDGEPSGLAEPTQVASHAGLAPISPSFVVQTDSFGGPIANSVVVAPDGSAVYANVPTAALDIGLLAEWALAGLLLLLALIRIASTLRTLVRAWRRPQSSGRFCCEQCNHEHASRASAGVCPECGQDLAKVSARPGAGVLRRTARSAAIAALVALLAVVVLVSAWFVRPSRGWEWLSINGLVQLQTLGVPGKWLVRVGVRCESIVRVDVTTRAVRTLFVKPGITHFDLALTPDAHGIFVHGAKGPEVRSLPSGRVLARLRGDWRWPAAIGIGTPLVIGHTPSGEALLGLEALTAGSAPAQPGTRSGQAGDSVLVAWAWTEDGQAREVVRTESYINPTNPSPAWARAFLAVPGQAGRARYLSVPGFMEAYGTKSFEVRVFDEHGRELSRIDLGELTADGLSALTPDGSRLLVAGNLILPDFVGFRVQALAHGRVRRTEGALLPGGNLGFAMTRIWAQPESGLMLVGASGEVLVWDFGARRWKAMLEGQKGHYGFDPAGNARGSIVAATAQRTLPGGPFGAGGTLNVAKDVVIWRLPEVGTSEAQKARD